MTWPKDEALYITQVNQSCVLFKQQAFNATGEDHVLIALFHQSRKKLFESNFQGTENWKYCMRGPNVYIYI